MNLDRPIVTWHAYPPIPIRDHDWAVFRYGDEETGKYGWGRTKEEAIAALLDMEAEEAE